MLMGAIEAHSLTLLLCPFVPCLYPRLIYLPPDETDWKVIVIDKEDRWAPELNDVEDVERLLPGVVDSIREWFRR